MAAAQGTRIAALGRGVCHWVQPLFAKVNDSQSCSRKAQGNLSSALPGRGEAWRGAEGGRGARRKREQSLLLQRRFPFSTQCPASGRQDHHRHHPACSLCALPETVLLCHFKNTFLEVAAPMSSDLCPPLLWRGSGVSVGWTKKAEAGVFVYSTWMEHLLSACTEHNGQNPLPSWTRCAFHGTGGR